jgi:hypothetical protein
MNYPQLGILIFSLSGAWFMNDRRLRVRKWGPVLCLLGQPFWVWSSIATHQWGIFAMSFFYTAMNIRGIYNFWTHRK